jgi:tetratricopeptide (TPR) repeat protein
MPRYLPLICVLIALSLAPAFADAVDDLAARLYAHAPADWDQQLEQNRAALTDELLGRLLHRAIDAAGAGNLQEAHRYAQLADEADYVRRNKKLYAGITQGLLGKALLDARKYTDATQIAQALLTTYPQNFWGNLIYGSALVYEGHIEQARAPLQAAITANPRSEDAHVMLGVVFVKMGDIKSAQQEFQTTLDINPKNAYAHDAIATLNGQRAGTTGSLSKVPAAQQHFNQAESAFQQGHFNEAIAEYKQAIEADPKFAKAWLYMGDCYFGAKGYAQAAEAYEQAVRLDPSDSQAQFFLGDAYQALYDQTRNAAWLDKSIASYQEALRIYPDYRNAAAALERARRKKAQAPTSPGPTH